MLYSYVLLKKDFIVHGVNRTPSVYFKKGNLYSILDAYGGTTMLWNDVARKYRYVPKKNFYSVAETLLKIREMKINKLKENISKGDQ